MAVSIPQGDATVAIRAATSAENVDPAVNTVIGYLYAACVALVEEYAPEAPDSVHNIALIRLLGWMYDTDPTDPSLGRAMMVSGAAPLLGQWRVHRAGVIGDTDAAGGTTPVAPGAGLPPAPASGHYILSVNDGTLVWLEFPDPEEDSP